MSEPPTSTAPRARALAALGVAAACAAAVGAPGLAVGVVAEALVVLAVWRVVLPIHGRWLERWALASAAALVVVAVDAADGERLLVSSPLALCLLADGAALALARGWFDGIGLAARAAAIAADDPDAARRLARRAQVLGAPRTARAPEPPPPPLPTDEPALLARLDALAAWEHGAYAPPAPRSRFAAGREVLVEAAGAPLLVAPVVGALLLAGLPAGAAWVSLHVLVVVVYGWGLCAVGGDRAVQRVDGAPKAVVVWAGLAAVAIVAAAVGFRVATQVGGLELDPGAGSAATLKAMAARLSRPEGRAVALLVLVGAAVPAALWGVLARLERTLEEVRPDVVAPPRRISSAVAGTPWFLACAVVFVVDQVALATFGWRALGLLSTFGAGLAAMHAFLVALAYGGLRLMDAPRREGRRRTVEDERRRVISALVTLRERRAAAGPAGPGEPLATGGPTR